MKYTQIADGGAVYCSLCRAIIPRATRCPHGKGGDDN
jgi:hypothetical protein